jgi:dienelactone hydrolase
MHTANVSYAHVDVELEGYLAYDPVVDGRRPAVLIAHAWAGQTDFERRKAEHMARLGYAAFAIDMYGKGVVGSDRHENARLIQPFLADRALLRDRIRAACDAVRDFDVVDPSRVAAIGFCFGGLCVLDLARSGAPVRGVVSVHGLLGPPGLAGAPARMAAKVLALHGSDDPFVPPEHVQAFAAEMTALAADWQMHVYGGERHAFTHREAEDPEIGNRYSPRAERRAMRAIADFLGEAFA